MGEQGLIGFEDDEVTVAEVMTAVEEQLAARREQIGVIEPHFPQYGAAAVYPEPPTDVPISMNLYYHLRLLNRQYNKLETETILTESAATRVPLLGTLWKQVRTQAHQLVLFYVNRMVGEQTEINSHLTHTLNEMTQVVVEQQRQIASLQAKIDRLQSE